MTDPAEAMDPVLDRVRELDLVIIDEAHRCIDTQAFLTDMSVLVKAFRATLAAGDDEDGAHPAWRVPGREEGPSSGPLPGECGELVGLLDKTAVEALISRSSLGTPEAVRLRRSTPPDRIAEILRRRSTAGREAQPRRPAQDQPGNPSPEEPHGPAEDLMCAHVVARAGAFQDGELTDDDRARIRRHLADCSTCLREYRLHQAVGQLVRKHCGCETAPEGLQDRVLAQIRTITRPDPLQARTPEELVRALRELRGWSGNSSYRQMARQAGDAVLASAMHAAMKGSVLPSRRTVAAIVKGCGGTADDQQRWAAAWAKVAAAGRAGGEEEASILQGRGGLPPGSGDSGLSAGRLVPAVPVRRGSAGKQETARSVARELIRARATVKDLDRTLTRDFGLLLDLVRVIERDSDRHRGLDRARSLVPDLDRDLNLMFDRVILLGAVIVFADASGSVRVGELILALTDDLARGQDLIRDLDRALVRANGRVRVRNRDLDSVRNLVPNLAQILDRARYEAGKVAEMLSAMPVDASGADLSDMRIEDIDVLDGVVWTRETTWPPGIRALAEEHSDCLGDDVFKVRLGSRGYDRVPDCSPAPS